MKKALTLTTAIVVLVVITATAALFALGATGRSQQTCGTVDPTELRAAGDPEYAKQLEQLARCR